MRTLPQLLDDLRPLHSHLCPRQVLGVRMGMLAGEVLALDLPQNDKRLLAIVETDGCAADGISVATNCWIGRHTLRVEDYGKVAATFVDTLTGDALRIVPRADSRQRALELAPEAESRWEGMLIGYQRLPADLIFTVQVVELCTPFERILSRPGLKAVCVRCGEEILNEREVLREGLALCQACAGEAYYRSPFTSHPFQRNCPSLLVAAHHGQPDDLRLVK
ncbi:MAG TPA: FmdE family protein [Anaerolineales bacterium]|nr:FmdE family protein [Anaerolineales bacterium]